MDIIHALPTLDQYAGYSVVEPIGIEWTSVRAAVIRELLAQEQVPLIAAMPLLSAISDFPLRDCSWLPDDLQEILKPRIHNAISDRLLPDKPGAKWIDLLVLSPERVRRISGLGKKSIAVLCGIFADVSVRFLLVPTLMESAAASNEQSDSPNRGIDQDKLQADKGSTPRQRTAVVAAHGHTEKGNESPPHISRPIPESFQQLVDVWFESLDDRQKQIVSARMGSAPQTLQALGDNLGVTRERIRQLEKLALKRLFGTVTANTLSTKLERTLHQLGGAATPERVEAHEPWFDGFAVNIDLVRWLSNAKAFRRPALFRVKGVQYLAACTLADWEAMSGQATRQLEFLLSKGPVPRDIAEASVRATAPLQLTSVATLLTSVTLGSAVLATSPSQGEVVVSLAQSLSDHVYATLLESEIPLHFTVVSDLVATKRGVPHDIRRVHNILGSTSDIHLLGRGTYGLRDHVSLSDAEALDLAEAINYLITDGPAGKQWHASEILEDLAVDDLAITGLDLYSVCFVIETRCPEIESLGRMVFHLRGGSRPERIDIDQAMISVLKAAGRPLSADEVVAALGRHRGLGRYSLLNVGAGYLRLADGRYGLLERDAHVDAIAVEATVKQLSVWCEARGHAVHRSELGTVLASSLMSRFPDLTVLLAYIRGSALLRISQGGYIHPASWDGPRRISIHQALQVFLEGASGRAWAVADAYNEVQRITGRQDLTLEYVLRSLESLQEEATEP